MCEIWLDDGGFLTTISPGKTAERTRAQWQTSIQAIKALQFSNSPFYRILNTSPFPSPLLRGVLTHRFTDTNTFGPSSTCPPHGCVSHRLLSITVQLSTPALHPACFGNDTIEFAIRKLPGRHIISETLAASTASTVSRIPTLLEPGKIESCDPVRASPSTTSVVSQEAFFDRIHEEWPSIDCLSRCSASCLSASLSGLARGVGEL